MSAFPPAVFAQTNAAAAGEAQPGGSGAGFAMSDGLGIGLQAAGCGFGAYSVRSTIIGSTLAARMAGTRQAATVTTMSSRAAAAKVNGSEGSTW